MQLFGNLGLGSEQDGLRQILGIIPGLPTGVQPFWELEVLC
jgi:hypothetical protein